MNIFVKSVPEGPVLKSLTAVNASEETFCALSRNGEYAITIVTREKKGAAGKIDLSDGDFEYVRRRFYAFVAKSTKPNLIIKSIGKEYDDLRKYIIGDDGLFDNTNLRISTIWFLMHHRGLKMDGPTVNKYCKPIRTNNDLDAVTNMMLLFEGISGVSVSNDTGEINKLIMASSLKGKSDNVRLRYEELVKCGASKENILSIIQIENDL